MFQTSFFNSIKLPDFFFPFFYLWYVLLNNLFSCSPKLPFRMSQQKKQSPPESVPTFFFFPKLPSRVCRVEKLPSRLEPSSISKKLEFWLSRGQNCTSSEFWRAWFSFFSRQNCRSSFFSPAPVLWQKNKIPFCLTHIRTPSRVRPTPRTSQKLSRTARLSSLLVPRQY